MLIVLFNANSTLMILELLLLIRKLIGNFIRDLLTLINAFGITFAI